MEGALLRLFFFLVASRGGAGQLLSGLCPLKGPGSHRVAYYCPGLQDPAKDRFCCGTCNKPFCCSSPEESLDPTSCPDFKPVPEVTSPPTSPTTPSFGVDGRLNVLWCVIGIFVGTLILWAICRNLLLLRCSRFYGGRGEEGEGEEGEGEEGEEEEEEEAEEETEIEERGAPVPPPPILLHPPSPPRYFDDYPPPYSSIEPLASLPVSVTNAPLRMGPAEDGVEGGGPAQLPGAEGGARSRLRGAEGGIPPGFREAEWGDPPPPPPYPDDPPPYSDIDLYASVNLPPPVARASRRKRRAKARRSVRRAPAEPPGAEGGAPAEAPGAAGGGLPAEPPGAEGGAVAM